MNTLLYTALALIAFAGNSILCRLALGEQSIDAASFTIIRLGSGILMLMAIMQITAMGKTQSLRDSTAKGSWKASLMLFLYAVCFSYAYISLETGVGALILFGAVQITIILIGIHAGNKLNALEWAGVFIAFGGFIYLVLPGLATPSLWGFVLMLIAGIAWGLYTLAGKSSQNPLADTAFNFLRTAPFVVVLGIITLSSAHITAQGIILAVLSGAVASGLGYTIWYMALKGITALQAAVLQLLVPVIAAAGGILFADETLTLRLILSGLAILGGILLVILGRQVVNKRGT